MCLILLAYRVHPVYPFVVAANRDEYYDRATEPAHFWKKCDNNSLLAGKDLQAGGTWMGLTPKSGRFAAVTNYRQKKASGVGGDDNAVFKKSRGKLVTDFLQGNLPAVDYLKQVSQEANSFDGFNLLLGDDTGLYYYSNKRAADGGVIKLKPGRIYGLCNRLLDDPWPKVRSAKARFTAALQQPQSNTTSSSDFLTEDLFRILMNKTKAPVHELPTQQTGYEVEFELLLSSIFIESDSYGTRASTVITVSSGEEKTATFTERSYGKQGKYLGSVSETFAVDEVPGGDETAIQQPHETRPSSPSTLLLRLSRRYEFATIAVIAFIATPAMNYARQTINLKEDFLRNKWWLLLGAWLVATLVREVILPARTWKGRRLLLCAWRQATWYEFWPMWLAYPPVVLQVLYLMIVRYGGKPVFTAVNPAMPSSGFIGDSKSDILDGLNSPWVAKYRLLQPEEGVEPAVAFMQEIGTDFPVILKPDSGQRGEGVAVIHTREQMEASLALRHKPTLIQAFAPGREFGVFYFRYPSESRGHIYSITDKCFTTVTGDGSSTLETLILAHDRAVCMAPFFLKKHCRDLMKVPPKGRVVALHDIGNHSKGALCCEGSQFITPELTTRIDEISKGYKGFYYGRYDIRTPDLDEFRRGENFKILELNGVTSESLNLLDPKYTLLDFYRTWWELWTHAFAIGAENHRSGAVLTSAGELLSSLRGYRAEKELATNVQLRD